MMTHCQRENWRPRRYGGMLLGFGYRKTTNYIGAPILGRTYYVYTQKNLSPYLKSYMRGLVEVTPEGDRWRIGHLPKDTGGRTCKGRPKNMQRSVISARDSP